MFGFLKDKLKGALSRFTKKVEEAPEEERIVEKEVEPPKKSATKASQKGKPKVEKKEAKPKKTKEAKPVKTPKVEEKIVVEVKKAEETKPRPEPVKVELAKPSVESEPAKIEPPKQESKGFFSKLKETFVGKEEVKVEKPEVAVKEENVVPDAKKAEPVSEKGFFARITEKITTKKITSEMFDELFWDLELALLENNVAVEVIEKIKSDLKLNIVDRPVPRGKVEEVIASSLHESVEGLFNVPSFDVISMAKGKQPFVICFIGINGSGKTTSIAKFTSYLQRNGLSVVLAAADTFRAAAIDQLQLHADNLGVKLIKHDYGSDPAAVAFDAIKHAQATKKDVVLIDTAGRLHSNVNLVDEMKKIVRVAKPDLKIFVGESITGNDCIEQAKKFDEAVGIDGIILSKADIDEKGGAAISVSYVTKKPILFLGVGQEYKDLQPFDKEKLLASIGL